MSHRPRAVVSAAAASLGEGCSGPDFPRTWSLIALALVWLRALLYIAQTRPREQ